MNPDTATGLMLLISAGLLVGEFHFRHHPRRRWAGALLAGLWQMVWRFMLYGTLAAAIPLALKDSPAALHQVPVDTVIALSLTLGMLPQVRGRRFPVWALLIADTALVSVLLLDRIPPVPVALTVLPLSAIIVIPAHCLARWTEQDRRLYLRATLQTLCWIALLLWWFPSLVFQAGGGSWRVLLERDPLLSLLYLAPLLLPGLLLGNAVFMFAVQGRGTAFPYDPPGRLVTGGVYRYVSNPMQLGTVLLMAGWGLALESLWLALSSLAAIALFIAFKDVCNGSCQIGRQDPNWTRYQQQVPKWIPRIPARDLTPDQEPRP